MIKPTTAKEQNGQSPKQSLTGSILNQTLRSFFRKYSLISRNFVQFEFPQTSFISS